MNTTSLPQELEAVRPAPEAELVHALPLQINPNISEDELSMALAIWSGFDARVDRIAEKAQGSETPGAMVIVKTIQLCKDQLSEVVHDLTTV